MLYRLIQIILRVYLPLFFRRVEVRGKENVPNDRPVIFAVNHQNAFMDGMLVALKLRRPVYFLTRSDVFTKKWIVKLFTMLNLIPIYRKQDGHADGVQANKDTFRFCIQELKKRKAVLIFPEGQSRAVHHLFPLKKGVARLAFEAEEKYDFNLKLHIIPVAINYENHYIAGKKVFVDYLSPIIVSEYKNIFHQNKAKATSKLLDDIQFYLKENLIHVEGDYKRFRRKYWRGILRQSRNDKEIIAAIKSIPVQGEEFSLRGYNWKSEKYKYLKKKSPLSRLYFFLLCLPGFLVFLPTILLSKLLTNRVKDEDFYLSVTALVWLLLGILQIVISTIYIWNYTDGAIGATAIFVQIVLAIIVLRNHLKFR